MGCVNSHTDINDLHLNVFQVMNVDNLGNLITPGRLKVTDTDIILYQRGKTPVKWPLRCLRRYGYDAEIFSFESGRRCSTGAGIYAFKCRRAGQLFNLVQTNIQQVCTNGDDTISRDMSIGTHSGPIVTSRVTIPSEPNYLDPTTVGNLNRNVSRSSQQNRNGRLSSIGSSSGPMSPQGTMGSPSPPPTLPSSLPPPPPITSHVHLSSLYVNEEVLQSTMAADMEHNNNKSLARRSMQRSHTVSSSTSSSGFLSFEQVSGHVVGTEALSSSHNRAIMHPQASTASYMNIDLASDASPLSPSHSTCDSSTPLREEAADTLESSNGIARAYMNISPGQEKIESLANIVKTRPPALSILPHQSDSEDGSRHCYANLEASEIEGLKKRFSATFIADKLPLQSHTPPPHLNSSSSSTVIRGVSYAVLDLDKKEAASNIGGTITSTTNVTTTTTTTTITPTTTTTSSAESIGTTQPATPASPPDSPLKPQQIGYVTIDFNKTTALSHSVNSSLVNDIDEGSRKTRHNSTISEFILPPSTRHNSSMSE
ncbi:hypothetical protein TSAR_016603 [Trichomalopsis sarcophagae]|uniref:IRS-type PTB domain-containing protein n=1 Tax=Trichomalopsis sarcophagae TaxID=543379 RepID=A0A232EXD0_9HYME|nr:hypothetical protein TSAR_016603 [Trichomalopsis sarcophagae]